MLAFKGSLPSSYPKTIQIAQRYCPNFIVKTAKKQLEVREKYFLEQMTHKELVKFYDFTVQTFYKYINYSIEVIRANRAHV